MADNYYRNDPYQDPYTTQNINRYTGDPREQSKRGSPLGVAGNIIGNLVKFGLAIAAIKHGGKLLKTLPSSTLGKTILQKFQHAPKSLRSVGDTLGEVYKLGNQISR